MFANGKHGLSLPGLSERRIGGMRYSQIDPLATGNQMKAELVIYSRRDEVTAFLRRLLKMLMAHDFPASDMVAIQLAVEEALLNAIRHGNQMDVRKRVHVTFAMGPRDFRIRIKDEGRGFDAELTSDLQIWQEPSRAGRRGLWLMRQYMPDVQFSGKGNVVTLSRRRSSKS
jgi:serine/threonine-protein kinase RsbW